MRDNFKERGFVGAIEQDITSTRFVIFSVDDAKPFASHQLELKNVQKSPG